MRERFDFLVIGSGVAGLSFALRAAAHGTVCVVTKKESAESNTNYAQGGIAAVMDAADDVEAHVQDTLVAGAGLCDEDVVRMVVTEGPDRIRDLIDLGAQFDRDPDGALHLGREGGHSAHRIVHAADMTGREVERALLTAVRRSPQIEVLEYHYAVNLLTEHQLGADVAGGEGLHCFGAYVLDSRAGVVKTVLARATLLAAGGAGQAYQHTTNPPVATGDGIAMAYRARATVANMEFVQFHPTSLYLPGEDFGGRSFLITEAVRGDGGLLRNLGGERFMPAYDDREELAPRDVVARAIDDQLKKRGEDHVWLDISHKPAEAVLAHFPNIHETLLAYGIDMTRGPIPVVPAAHYTCGGVVVDHEARTSIAGLFACGEVTCSGLHGANRLASNSLLEALVYAERAVEPARAHAAGAGWEERVPDWDESRVENAREWVLVSHNRQELRRVMQSYVGIVRSELRLGRAARRVGLIYQETEEFYQRTRLSAELCELRNLAAVAHLIVSCAQRRTESRGLHFMADFPEPDPAQRHDTVYDYAPAAPPA
ncbi:L-aspartate oxidase [Rubrivirga sp. S365]|uniref:L-aspartate oxidase n=1 Tax=Rubrivirga litoralis TaxID=3075598 RepID=A0ABU3BUV8_9BACT|nr:MULTISPECIES: L-aspartate oxidase [unclassified Rubrivirga]MDT0633077.1 L-aspartate oxidase [Rubrivirga sp. F394]MDT7856909.1 L-aspartate oxidase [Rubrivirga sp. S365]